MKKRLSQLLKLLLILMGIILLILIILALSHHIGLRLEADKIIPVGNLVEVAGHRMNIYTEGKKQSSADPTIVLLSGSGVAAPIYDYKNLYTKLSGSYKVAVVEKFGYGYSDISGMPRDVATMVEQNREALAKAGESAPYVLMPHSMSALEAIYWAYTYPQEVQAIIGLDMAVPQSYHKDNIAFITLIKASVFFGFHRFEFLNPVSSLGLSKDEHTQHKLLNNRNALNTDVYNECKVVLKNAATVRNMDIGDVPLLMFTTNLGNGNSDESKIWVAAQEDFVSNFSNGTQIKYDCGHNLHYYQSDEIAAMSLRFLDTLQQ